MISIPRYKFTDKKTLHVVGEKVVGTLEGMVGFTDGERDGTVGFTDGGDDGVVGFTVDKDRKVGLFDFVGLRERVVEGEAVGRAVNVNYDH
jgi:hypothetical protein